MSQCRLDLDVNRYWLGHSPGFFYLLLVIYILFFPPVVFSLELLRPGPVATFSLLILVVLLFAKSVVVLFFLESDL